MRWAGPLLALVLAAPAAAQDANTWSTIERGLYLTRVGDCTACHTAEESEPFAGDLPLPTPFGTIYSANLTPDPETGLGDWSADEFYRSITRGVNAEGQRLYPAFPYTHFTVTTREDSDAIFAYLSSIEPVRNVVREPEFPWPLSWRFSMAGWNLVNFDPHKLTPVAEQSEAWNRGRYLVEGIAHCSACHSPRNVTGAEKEGEASYTGGMAEGWHAPPLREGAGGAGLGDWSETELAEFLRYGRNGRTAAFGPMSEVVRKSTQYLTDADLAAVVAYLKDLPMGPVEGEPPEPVAAETPAMRSGAEIYATQCSACHGPEGGGVATQFGELAGSSLAQSDDPTTVIRLILEGVEAAPTERYPTPHAMPAFGWKLTDAEVADVATYVRNSFGNAAPAVSTEAVADIRNAGE